MVNAWGFADSNVFENYFSASAVAEVERLIAGDQARENDAQEPPQ